MPLPYEYRLPTAHDRSNWNPGPWQQEPDIAVWTMDLNKHTTYCVVLRHPTLGHFCGYIGMGEHHPAYNVNAAYDGDFVPEVHGGITWDKTRDNIRWLGFDCSHGSDLSPSKLLPGYHDSIYRDFDYVMRNVRELARQAAIYSPRNPSQEAS